MGVWFGETEGGRERVSSWYQHLERFDGPCCVVMSSALSLSLALSPLTSFVLQSLSLVLSPLTSSVLLISVFLSLPLSPFLFLLSPSVLICVKTILCSEVRYRTRYGNTPGQKDFVDRYVGATSPQLQKPSPLLSSC